MLDIEQQKDLEQYVLNRKNQSGLSDDNSCINSELSCQQTDNSTLTEIQEGDLYFCLEKRKVSVRKHIIELTAKEFDILALLILNPGRVFTYEMISDIVWNEEDNEYSRKAINNHICNLRRKLKVTPDIPNYIKSVHSVGYKFDV